MQTRNERCQILAQQRYIPRYEFHFRVVLYEVAVFGRHNYEQDTYYYYGSVDLDLNSSLYIFYQLFLITFSKEDRNIS